MLNFELILVPIAIAVATRVAAGLYRYSWQRLRTDGSVPTGFGVLLPIFLLAIMFLFDDCFTAQIAPVAIIVVSVVAYWVDDASGLSPAARLAIAFLCGALLAAVVVGGSSDDVFWVVATVICAGVLCVILANIINFYDGADLNLASMIAITAVVSIIFSSASFSGLTIVGILMLGFAAGFATVNRTPSTLYLGDAGSFAYAAILTWFSAQAAADWATAPIEILCALALPAFDVFFVLLIRLKNRHDLLSRNYLHLYQRLQVRFAGRFYLWPQLINAALILIMASGLQSLGAERWFAVIFAGVLITPVFYLYCRRRWVEPEYFFGDGRVP